MEVLAEKTGQRCIGMWTGEYNGFARPEEPDGHFLKSVWRPARSQALGRGYRRTATAPWHETYEMGMIVISSTLAVGP